MKIEKISDVFRTTGQPTITYVERSSGNYERRLNSYLDERGQLCLITGPSKTGKTTLYKKVLETRSEVPLVVQCTAGRTCDEIWRVALEGVNFERVASHRNSDSSNAKLAAEASGEFGWKWLAKVTGKLSGELSENATEEYIRERVLSSPSPDLLIPILQKTAYVLVIEDFHYLDDEEKVLLFQQWKRFIDSEISIIVLGTTHRSVDIANSNKDLIGRVSHIDIGRWDQADLSKICEKGFKYLRQECNRALIDRICAESVGLPIIVQQVCLKIYNSKNIFSVKDARKTNSVISTSVVDSCFTDVASEKYSQLETYYKTLIRGPREKNRKYRTYELVIACFTVNPITFSLTRSQIDERLNKLDISNADKPPAASVNSTLGALKKFQDKRDFRLLEWMAAEDTLYIVEPSFLFYVRWRIKGSNKKGTQLDLFSDLLKSIDLEVDEFLDEVLNSSNDSKSL